MPPKRVINLQALHRLRTYISPPTSYYKLNLRNRAAVLLILFVDASGNLRIILTRRSDKLKTYAGDIAFPGGRADKIDEIAVQTARREAEEEIGLSRIAANIPHPFTIEHMCELPVYLARTKVAVRPCVVLLRIKDNVEASSDIPDPEKLLFENLDSDEVSAVFSIPLQDFLRHDIRLPKLYVYENLTGEQYVESYNPWYIGHVVPFFETKIHLHNFFVPVSQQNVYWDKRLHDQYKVYGHPDDAKTWCEGYRIFANSQLLKTLRKTDVDLLEWTEKQYPRSAQGDRRLTQERIDERKTLYNVKFLSCSMLIRGLTARILIDVARLAFNEEPEFPFEDWIGDEDRINKLLQSNYFTAKTKTPWDKIKESSSGPTSNIQ